MYSDERQSTRSPTTSRSDSYRDGPIPKTNGHAYQRRSSILEEDGKGYNEYEETVDDVDDSPPPNVRPPQRSEDQYIAALQYRFPNRPKTDYSYSKPPGPSIPTTTPLPTTTQPPRATTTAPNTTTPAAATTRTGPYQTSLRPTTGGTNSSGNSDDRTLPIPRLRPVNPDQQNSYARRIGADSTTPTSTLKPTTTTTTGPTVKFDESNINRNRPASTTFNQSNQSFDPTRQNESIFESVPSHGGPVSYLGIGTFSQFEHCLRECLERERRMTGVASHITRHDLPSNPYAHDFDYNTFATSSSSSPYHHGLTPTTVHQFTDYPSRPLSSFAIDDIRHINVALSRSGIPLFPYHQSYRDSITSYPPPMCSGPYVSDRHSTGEVVSACRVVEEDPAIMYNRNGTQAVQNVWNAIRNYQPSSHVERSRSSVSPRGLYDF